MSKLDTLVVDNSILSATAKCDTYSYVRYALGLNTREEGLALRAGQAIHSGMAAWLSGKPPAEAVKVMAEEYEKVVDNFLITRELERLGEDDARFRPEWVEAIFAQYLERYDGKWPFKVLAGSAEGPVMAPFGIIRGRDILFVARLDAIVRKWEAGDRWSMDHKSTRKASDWWVEKQKVSSQFSGQLWIAAQLGEPLAGVVLNVIEIPEPHKSDRKCAEHKVSYQECSVRHAGNHLVYVTRAPVEMASWEMSARRLTSRFVALVERAEAEGLEGVVDVSMQGRFNEGCTFCAFKDFCRLGRPTRKPKAFFVEDKWDPRKVDPT